MLATINGAQEDDALEERRLEKAFNTYWPELDTALTEISQAKLPHLAKRSLEDIAEETLNIVRDLQKQSVQPLAKAIMAPVQPLSELGNLYLLRNLMVAKDDPMTDESINTGKLYRAMAKTILKPPTDNQPQKSDKPKEK